MKVGLVSPYDFASPGGVTDHVRHLARQLRRLGHEVRVFAPSSRADVDFDSADFYRIGSPISVPVNDSVARITLSFHLADRVLFAVHQYIDDLAPPRLGNRVEYVRGCRCSGHRLQYIPIWGYMSTRNLQD